jgi:hypothetical protein
VAAPWEATELAGKSCPSEKFDRPDGSVQAKISRFQGIFPRHRTCSGATATFAEHLNMNISIAGAFPASSAITRNTQGRPGGDFAAALEGAQAAQGARARSPLLAAPLILPTRANVQQLVSDLVQQLSARFAAAGLPTTPGVSVSVDDQGSINVGGNRSDLARIQTLIDGDMALQKSIRDANAIASHAYEIESGGHLEFQRAYRLSADTKEIVAQYAHLFGGKRPAGAITLEFSGTSLAVAAEGKTWLGG